jgi:small basic protein
MEISLCFTLQKQSIIEHWNGVSVCVGNFNVGVYIGLTSNAHRLPNLISFYTSMLLLHIVSILYDGLRQHLRSLLTFEI